MKLSSTGTSPVVSVCVPTYNYAHFLSDAIESICSQTFTDLEVIIIDNCSTDNTQEIVAKYVKIDQRIRYVRNETNIGLLGNLNKCIQLASGEYIKILCSDDVLDRTCLEKMVKALDGNPDAVLVSCSRLLVDSALKPIGELSYSKKYQTRKGTRVIKQCFFKGNLIGEPSAVLFRRKDATRGFDANYSQLMDIDMWFNLLEKGDFVFIPEPLCKFRQHENQGTKLNIRTFSTVDDELLLYRKYINKWFLGATFINRQRWRFHLAEVIWNHAYTGVDKNIVKAKLRQHYPLFLFFLFHYLNIFIDVLTRGVLYFSNEAEVKA